MKITDNNARKIYILSFIIPMMLYCLLGVVLRLYPLSDRTILFSDMNSQFVSFYNFFRNILTSNNDFFYTFSKTLGGDMMGFSAYYLQNPFIFILLLFPYENLPLGIYLMEITMLSLACVAFQLFLVKSFNRCSLVFSTAYGMMGYALAYFMLSIYTFNFILLPIVMMGLIMMLRGEKKGKIIYSISLGISIICNYYLGYMLCLYLVIVFVCLCFEMPSLHAFWEKLKLFAIYSVLGVMLSAFDLIPIVLSLRNQKDAPSTGIFELTKSFGITELYKAFLPGIFNPSIINQSLPHLYFGLFPLCFALIFFIINRVELKKKIAAVVAIIALIVSLYFKPINTIWHGFNEPVGFPFRFAFYLSFTLICIGFMGYCVALDELKTRITFAYKYLGIVLLLATIFDLTYNAYYTLNVNVTDAATESYYVGYRDRITPILTEIKSREDDKSLYRFEKDTMYTMVDPMAFDYAGLSHNSSCEKYAVKHFMGKMGFRDQGIWAFYNQGSTTFADCFLSVKYFASRFDTTEKPYIPIYNSDDLFLFENPYALGFASIVNKEEIRRVDFEGDNSFEFQNEIARSYGFKDNIFEKVDISEIRLGENVILSEDAENKANRIEKGVVKVEGEGCFAEFDLNVEKQWQPIYFYFNAPKYQGARIYINGMDFDDYFTDHRWNVEKAGVFPEGISATIRVEATGESLNLNDYQFYCEDLGKLAEWRECAKSLGSDTVELNKKKSSHITGTFEAKEDGMLLFSIPYDKGWHIKIDGKAVENEQVLSTLLAVEVVKGTHTIEMRYVPSGLVIGSVISLLGLFILVYSLKNAKGDSLLTRRNVKGDRLL